MRCFVVNEKTRLYQFEGVPSPTLTRCFFECVTEIEQWPEVLDVYFGYTDFLVEWSAKKYADRNEARVSALLEEQLTLPLATTKTELHHIDVRYNGQDLMNVAKVCSLSAEQVIEIHSQSIYHVYAIGFQPGFAFLGQLDPRIQLPRKEVPLRRVPPGSLAIAADQTAVYPHASPGGWHLIGQVKNPLFDVGHPQLLRLTPGDRVKFNPC